MSSLGLAVLSPVLGLIAAVLRLRHGKPVIFRQERVGLGGEPFVMHKFRTMTASDGRGPLVTQAQDARIHRVGAVLRSTKLDELPQLWDVLRGKMSVVGPRPEVAKYVALWPEGTRDVILSVRPGITDPASLVYRHEEAELASAPDPVAYYENHVLPRKAAMYVDYVHNQSTAHDIRLILQTVLAIFRKPPESVAPSQ